MKRFISLLLVSLMLLTAFTACTNKAGDDNTTQETTLAEPDSECTDIPDEISELPDDLYFNNSDFKYLLRSDRSGALQEFQIDSLSEESTTLDRAVYNRQLSIESRLGVRFVYDSVEEANMVTVVRNDIQSNMNSFDVAVPGASKAPTLALEGLLQNWWDVPYVSLDKVWWGSRSGMADSLTVNGNLYFISGDASNLAVGKALCMYFNKALLDLSGVISSDELYREVLDYQWTIERLLGLSSMLSKDMDGDGMVSSEADLYGCNFYLKTIADNYFAAFDIPIVTQDSYGDYTVALNNDRMITAIEKLHALCYEDNRTYLTPDKVSSVNFFTSNHAVFTHGGFEWAVDFRNMADDYGIIPYPMLDAEQGHYGTSLSDVYSTFIVSKSSDKLDMIGAVMELTGSLSYETTTYAYYDVLLKGHSARDPISVTMLDLIHDSIDYNIGFVYGPVIGSPHQIFRRMLATPTSNNWTNDWTSRGATYKQKLDQLLNS